MLARPNDDIPRKSEILERLYQTYFDAIQSIIINALPNYDGANPIRISSATESKINIPCDIKERVEGDLITLFKGRGWKVSFFYDKNQDICLLKIN